MTKRNQQMHIGAAIEETGVQPTAWRLPSSDSRDPSIDHFVDQARIAEDACLDFIFRADGLGVRDKQALRGNAPIGGFEPISLLSALAMVTTHIGLVGTVSTSFSQPYAVARDFASLDHISRGRAAWNIVTSHYGAKNFSQEEVPIHEIRYAIAEEHVEACTRLWDSWEDGAKIFDRESGVFVDPEKIHEINFEGTYFQVEGPLNISRSPQGRPLLIQAGSSEWGMEFGSKWAEVVFTSQHDMASSVSFYRDFKDRVARRGRNPEQVPIMPGISTFTAATEQEAREKWLGLNDWLDPARRIQMVELNLHIDLSEFELDDVVPAELLPPVSAIEGHQSRYEIYRNWVVNDKRTIRELAAEATSAAGHWLIVGSGEQVADRLIERFENFGADGFNLVPAATPSTLADFTEFVVPILQERGYFRTEYPGGTLREMLGIDRPDSQYAS